MRYDFPIVYGPKAAFIDFSNCMDRIDVVTVSNRIRLYVLNMTELSLSRFLRIVRLLRFFLKVPLQFNTDSDTLFHKSFSMINSSLSWNKENHNCEGVMHIGPVLISIDECFQECVFCASYFVTLFLVYGYPKETQSLVFDVLLDYLTSLVRKQLFLF